MNPNFFTLSKTKESDILSRLLTGNSFEGVISKKELNALIKVIGEAAKREATPENDPEKMARILAGKQAKTVKRKATYSLSGDVFKRLEKVTREIRSALPEEQQRKVTKARVVNQAVALMLEEYISRGKNSRLARSLLQVN